MPTTVRILTPTDAHLLSNVAPEVFDNPVDPTQTAAFFADPHHVLAAALDGELLVGMASGVRYFHPDKAPELFVNEVGVSLEYRGQGLGRRLVDALTQHAREQGCAFAWVLTEEDNAAARRLYAAAGGLEEQVRLFVFPLETSPA